MKLSALAYELFHAADTPAAIMRQDGLLLHVNDAFTGIAGYKKTQLEGKRNLASFVSSEEIPKILAMQHPAFHKSRAKKPAAVEIAFSGRWGQRTPVRVAASALPGTRTLLLIIRPAHCLTAEATKANRQRFGLFFEQNDAAILVFDPRNCAVVDANLAASALFGYRHDELVSEGLGLFAEPNELDNLIQIIGTMPSSERSYVMTYFRRDGIKSILRFRATVIRMSDGDLVYCSFRDIGEEVRLREELRSRQAQLIHANKMGALGMLVSSVAHEISNPNNFIMHNIQILTDAWKDVLPILRDYYQEHGDYYLGGIPLSEFEEVIPRLVYGIHDGSERIRNIVANLREYVRSDRAKLQSSVDISAVVMNAVALMRSEISRHTNAFQLLSPEGLPFIRGSAQKLEQVVINLLMNALQSLSDRNQAVSLQVTYDAGTDDVLLTIRDEGVGMTEQVQAKILEPFFSTKLERGGTGLGLYISHSIVCEHKGTMRFTSESGVGTTVTVRIPAVLGKAGHDEGRQPLASGVAG